MTQAMTEAKGRNQEAIKALVLAPMNSRSLTLLSVLLLTSIAMELLACLGVAPFSWLAPRIWLAAGMTFSAVIVARACRRLLSDLHNLFDQRNRQFLPVILTLGVIALLAWPVLDPARSVIGQDATQQLAAGLQAYRQSDWNYGGTAFLGYPSRQYLLAALPALVLGRTTLALKMGFAWPFWAGLLIFADGLRGWAREKGVRAGDVLAFAATTSVLVFPYVTEYYLYFEHTLYPVCFTLQLIGWLFHYSRKPNLFHALAVAWTGCVLIYCYTTALAVVLLLIVLLGHKGLAGLMKSAGLGVVVDGTAVGQPASSQSRSPHAADRINNLGSRMNGVESKLNLTGNIYWDAVNIRIAGTVASALAISILLGRSDRVSVLRSPQFAELFQAALTGLRIALTSQPAVYASFLLPFVWLYLLLALSFRIGRLHVVIAGWSLGVFMLSQVLQGYAVYPAPISFSRTLVTVPVIATAWFLLLADVLTDKARKLGRKKGIALALSLALLSVLNLSVAFDHVRRPLVQGDAAKYLLTGHLQPMQRLMADLSGRAAAAGISAQDEFDFVLYTDNVWLKNPADYMGYFYPKASITVLESGRPLPENLNAQIPTVIYIIEGRPAEDVLAHAALVEDVALKLDHGASIELRRLIRKPE